MTVSLLWLTLAVVVVVVSVLVIVEGWCGPLFPPED